MSGEAPPVPDDGPAAERAVPSRRRGLGWRLGLLGAVLLVLMAAAGALWWLDTPGGHRFLAARISEMRPASGLRVELGRIDGSIYSKVVLHDVRLGDPDGRVASIPLAYLDWYPLAWFSNRLDIDRLYIPWARLDRVPRLRPGGPDRPILPRFDVRIAALRIERLAVGPAIAGSWRTVHVRARGDIRSGRALLHVRAYGLGFGDALRLSFDCRPDANRFDLGALALAPKGGVLAGLAGVREGFIARIDGVGDWTHWRGGAVLAVGRGAPSRLRLEAKQGLYALSGTLESAALGTGLAARLAAPRARIEAKGRLEDRIVTGTASLASPAATLEAEGGIDLGRSAFDNLVLTLRPARATALVRGLSGEDMLIRMRLAGAFDRAAYDYVVRARTLRIAKVRVTALESRGSGRLNPDGASTIPLRIRAARVLLDSPAVDDVLRDVRIDGLALLEKGRIITRPIAVRTAKLSGKLTLLVDPGAGTLTTGFTGEVRGLELQGLGRVDLSGRLEGRGRGGAFGLTGRARATMTRLDNGFLRGLGQGLPVLDGALRLGGDGRLALDGLTLRAPGLTLTGQGYRDRDGQFHLRATGTHRDYGPLRLALDGRIERPQIDVLLARPVDALGLADVHAVLMPEPAGYQLAVTGGSPLGPFTGTGEILLPHGGPALVRVLRLSAGGMSASGLLYVQEGGLVGTLDLDGAAKGTVRLARAEGVPQVALDLNLNRLELAGPPTLRIARGRLRGTVLLRPGATMMDLDAQGRGLAYGSVRLGRFAAAAHLVNGEGSVSASVQSGRGRLFDLQMRADIAPGTARVDASGTIDRVPLTLANTAVLTREGDGWRLAPTRLDYRGGALRLAGLFGPGTTRLQADMSRMPLLLLDLVNGDLALGGLASGHADYDAGPGRSPTGRLSLRVRGLTRAGLALTSAPVDIGLNAELSASRAALRGVIASGGVVTGRAQALMTPLGSGTLLERLNAAPLRAQLRYAGNLDTLWRLTDVELFNLAGMATIRADVSGTLAEPNISGAVASNDVTLHSPVTGMTLSRLVVRGSFDGSSLSLDSLEGQTRGGGQVEGRGRFTFSGERGVGIDLSARLDNAILLDRDDIGATVSGPIRIQSDGDGGTISGTLAVRQSRFTLGRAAEVATIPEMKVVELNGRAGDDTPSRAAAPWRLAIDADVPGRLNVTGLGMQSEWSARLNIGGTVISPVLSGTADLVHGDYDFAGKRFELTEGRLRFNGERPIDPALAIKAASDVSDISATISITGTSSRPIISFASTPTLPQDELLSRILFGTSVTQLSAPEAIQLASAVAALQGGDGGLDPINAVRRVTGLSRLRILPADTTTGQKTSVAAGKNITRAIYVELITDGQGYSATRVEYQITRWLALLSSVSTVGRQGVNLRVKKDY